MARKFYLIKDIDEKKETLKLVGRVKDLWFVQNQDMNRHMELILLDQKVNKVCCVLYFWIWNDLYCLPYFFRGI